MSLNNHVNDQDEKKVKNEDKPQDEKKIKTVSYTRRANLNGVYSTYLKGRELVIKNREIFQTSDLEEIGFLNNDPELTKIKK